MPNNNLYGKNCTLRSFGHVKEIEFTISYGMSADNTDKNFR